MIEKLKKDESWGGFTDEEGISYDSKKNYLQCGVFDFCGCGYTLRNLMYIRDMLLKVKNKKINFDKDVSHAFFMYWADSQNLIEHGTSIGGSWIDEKGEKFLKDMEIIIKENEE